ncbi:abc transporter b family member 28 [Nannochloropsis gaditana]|uniref:Abc transporter b family member 28 n=1 Tax=Nannochloropsis gaditana TaxID=72520 RepID=W7T665_9STRA|nr:abc transporter b family member 28 [Nannochloropsis gaditana]
MSLLSSRSLRWPVSSRALVFCLVLIFWADTIAYVLPLLRTLGTSTRSPPQKARLNMATPIHRPQKIALRSCFGSGYPPRSPRIPTLPTSAPRASIRRFSSMLASSFIPAFLRRRGGTTANPPPAIRPSTSPPPSSPPSLDASRQPTTPHDLQWAAFAGPSDSPTRLRKRDLAIGGVLSVLATVAAVSVPLGYGGVVNVLLLPAETPLLERKMAFTKALRLLACIYSAEPFLTWVYIRHMTGLFSKGVLNLKNAVFTRLLEQDVAFFDRAGPGEITSYLSQDISGLKDILYGNLQRDRGLRALLEAVVGTILLFKLQPRLGLVFSLVIPTVATITVSIPSA